jgi:hypothetical protein
MNKEKKTTKEKKIRNGGHLWVSVMSWMVTLPLSKEYVEILIS